jgi:hypothetical protein
VTHAAMTTRDEIVGILSAVDGTLASKLVDRYTEMRTLESVRRWEDCLEKAGKFAEEVYRFVYLAVCGTSLAEVEKMDDLRRNLENAGESAPESLRLLIPRITQRVIWDLRSKRGGGHIKPINPNRLDCKLVLDAASWILAELARLYGESDPDLAAKLVDQLLSFRVPTVERFGDEALVVDRRARLSDQVLMVLASENPARVSEDELFLATRSTNRGSLTAALTRLESEQGYLHRNAHGCKITGTGLNYILKLIADRAFSGT